MKNEVEVMWFVRTVVEGVLVVLETQAHACGCSFPYQFSQPVLHLDLLKISLTP